MKRVCPHVLAAVRCRRRLSRISYRTELSDNRRDQGRCGLVANSLLAPPNLVFVSGEFNFRALVPLIKETARTYLYTYVLLCKLILLYIASNKTINCKDYIFKQKPVIYYSDFIYAHLLFPRILQHTHTHTLRNYFSILLVSTYSIYFRKKKKLLRDSLISVSITDTNLKHFSTLRFPANPQLKDVYVSIGRTIIF